MVLHTQFHLYGLFSFIFFTFRDLRTAVLAFYWLVREDVYSGTCSQRSVCV
jgi:hypothetical protein